MNRSLNGQKGKMVVATRFELATPTMSRWCSNQLSYATTDDLLIYCKRGPLPYPKLAICDKGSDERDVTLSDRLGLFHSQHIFLDAGNFIPNLRSLFEFQVLGVLVHLLLQLGNALGQLAG